MIDMQKKNFLLNQPLTLKLRMLWASEKETE